MQEASPRRSKDCDLRPKGRAGADFLGPGARCTISIRTGRRMPGLRRHQAQISSRDLRKRSGSMPKRSRSVYHNGMGRVQDSGLRENLCGECNRYDLYPMRPVANVTQRGFYPRADDGEARLCL